jgi:hypothetical protein
MGRENYGILCLAMSNRLYFILTYSALTICLYMLSMSLFHFIEGEAAAYLLWYLLFTACLGIVLFLTLGFGIQAMPVNRWIKMALGFVLLLISLNCIPLFITDGKLIVTFDLFESLLRNKESSIPFNAGLHIIVVSSFILTNIVCRRLAVFD